MSRKLHQHQTNKIEAQIQNFSILDKDDYNKLSNKQKKLYRHLANVQGFNKNELLSAIGREA